MKKLIQFIIFIFIININVNAQTNDTLQWKKHLENNSLTYYQIIDSVEQIFSQHDSLKLIRKYGYKDFIRWREYWANRINSNGYIINLPQMIDSVLTNGNTFDSKINTSFTYENWSPVGLMKKPFNYEGELKRDGVGMVYTIEVNPLNPNIVLAGCPNGGIWRTDNAGVSWRPIKLIENSSSKDYGVIGVLSIKIDPFDTSRIFIATGSRPLEVGYTHKYSYGVLLSQNSGSTWERTGLTPSILFDENINALAIVGNTNLADVKVFAVGKNHIYVSNDGGSNFDIIDAQALIGRDLHFGNIEVLPNDDQIIFASGTELLASYDGGVNWEEKTSLMASSKLYNRFLNPGFDQSITNQWGNTTNWNIVNYSGNNVGEIIYNSSITNYAIVHRSGFSKENGVYNASFKMLLPANCTLNVKYYKEGNKINPEFSKTYYHTSNTTIVIQELIGKKTGIINRIEYEFVLGTGFVNTVLPWIDDSKLMCAAQTAILVECNPQLSNTLRTITVQRDPANFVYEEIDTRDFSILNYSIVPIGDYTAFSLGSSVKNTNTRFLGAVKLFKSEGGSTNFLGYNTNGYILHDDIRDIKSALDNSNNEIIYIAHDGGVAVSHDNGQTFSDRSNGLQIANFYNLSISENDPDLIIGGVHDNSTFVLNFGEWYTTSAGDGFGQTLLIEEKYIEMSLLF